jgi:hypothetical protein
VPKVLLPIPHQPQQSDGDCLAACAAMAMAHLGRAIDYAQLLKLLNIKPCFPSLYPEAISNWPGWREITTMR